MSDLIDRQDAIDAIHEDADWLAAQGSDWQVERTERDKSILMSLPSAEKAQLSGEDATFDCISRQATIDVEGLDEQIRCEICRNPMHTNRGCDGNCKYDEKLYERIMQILGERIKPSPSAEPRKKGKWLRLNDIDGFVRCSSCGTFWDYSIIDTLHFHFCPNCGSYNGGEVE